MRWRTLLAGVGATIAAGAAVTGAVVYSGLYNVAATSSHYPQTYDIISLALRRSVAFHSRGIEVPDDLGPERAARGMLTYQNGCVQCHGAPGVPPMDFALGMNPVPMNMHVAVSREDPEELFWVIKYGIKMTGMPAWEYRLSDEEIWDVTAFLLEIPTISPAEYRERLSDLDAGPPPAADPDAAAGTEVAGGPDEVGTPDQGRRVIAQYGCTACHQIPGVTGRRVHVGPPLDRFGSRMYIAGVLLNTPENLMRWLMDPVEVDPLTGMPDLGVTEAHARDMAAYLLTLQEDEN